MILLALIAAARIVTLEEALQTARARQPQLRQARAASEAAGARSGQALAPMLPQLSLTAGATPCAESTQKAPTGISSSLSTKTAPFSSSVRTTCSLWTIWWRT